MRSDFYRLKHEDKTVVLEFKKSFIFKQLGALVDLYLIDGDYSIFKVTSAFINLDSNYLDGFDDKSMKYKDELAKILLDKDRIIRLCETRSANLGAYRFENNKITKLCYDPEGIDSKKYREKHNLKLDVSNINLLTNKYSYNFNNNTIISSTLLGDGINYLIEYLDIENENIKGTSKSKGDLVNIYIIDKTITVYKNIFIDLEKVMLIGSSSEAIKYQKYLSNLLNDKKRNQKNLEDRNGYFGIIKYNDVTRKIEKLASSSQIDNIAKYRLDNDLKASMEFMDNA